VSLANLRVFVLQFAARRGRLIAGALGALSAGLVIGSLGFAALQIVPIYFKSYEFENAARREARLAAASLRSDDAIRDDVYQKAQNLGLPVDRGNIKVRAVARDSGASTLDSFLDPSATPNMVENVDMNVSYAVPVEFPV
jgi:hypothetical protein